MLRQAENKVKIEGILSETDLRYVNFERNGETKEAIGGSIKVLVEQEINGKAEALEIPVHMFSTKYTKRGSLNPSYESIEKVMKEFVSIASCGAKEQADKVRITSAEIVSNDFINQSGQIVTSPRIRSSFVSRAIGDFQPEATFTTEFMISSMNRVTASDGTEVDPPKLCIEAIIPQYGEKVDVIKFYANNPNVINSIEEYWEAGGCYRAVGRLNFTSTTQTTIEEVDFGEPIKKQRTINVSEFVITGGSQAPLDDDFAFSIEDIRKAMAERKERLESMKAKGSQKPTPAPAKKADKLDLGF